jgi:CheY-like chemotaxis protein
VITDPTDQPSHDTFPVTEGTSPIPAIDPLADAVVTLRQSPRINSRLADGEVFILDDDDAMLRLTSLLLPRDGTLEPDAITTINPKKIHDSIPRNDQRLEQALAAVTQPIVEAATDPEKSVSLVITDFEMAEITGELVIAKLQERLGDDLPFRVILNSGNREKALGSNCFYDRFLEKPVPMSVIRETLDELFPGS